MIWIRDEEIKPPGPKRVVCVEPFLGIFFRINSGSDHDGSVEILLTDHPFLKWDSYVECGDPLELDEYTINMALNQSGIIGRIHPKYAEKICAAVRACGILSRADRNAICKALGCE